MIKGRCHDGFHEFHMTLKKNLAEMKGTSIINSHFLHL